MGCSATLFQGPEGPVGPLKCFRGLKMVARPKRRHGAAGPETERKMSFLPLKEGSQKTVKIRENSEKIRGPPTSLFTPCTYINFLHYSLCSGMGLGEWMPSLPGEENFEKMTSLYVFSSLLTLHTRLWIVCAGLRSDPWEGKCPSTG